MPARGRAAVRGRGSASPARLVAAATGAITDVFGESVGQQTVVTLDGVPAGRSGVGGRLV